MDSSRAGLRDIAALESRKKRSIRTAVKSKRRESLTDEEAAQTIFAHREKARKLARSILRKWHSRLDLEELDSIVDLSLCEAVKRFNPTRGASFMTFLYYHLRGNLIKSIAEAAANNLLPVLDENGGLIQCRDGERFNPVSPFEIFDRLNTEFEERHPEEMIQKKELLALSNAAKSRLDSLEREVIERVYGGEEQLLDIAKDLGYSRCHISRVKRRALELLYDELSNKIGKEYMPPRGAFDEDDGAPRRRYHKITRRRRNPGA